MDPLPRGPSPSKRAGGQNKASQQAASTFLDWIDDVADRFEAAWKHDVPPRIADFLGAEESDRRSALLEELVKLDLEFRWQSGKRPRLEDYLAEFPGLVGPDGALPDHLVLFARQVQDWCRARSADAGPDTEPGPDAAPATLNFRCPQCGHGLQCLGGREATCTGCGGTFRLESGTATELLSAELPRTLGRFQLLELLGRGSFGAVYKARDAELDRAVAIKVPRTGSFSGREEEERFLREARSAAQLIHPAIVQVHEIAYEGAMPYIVSDYVEGRTLSQLAADRRPSFHKVAELVARIADAVDYAHRRGVIHRDINPRNILIDAAGLPHVTDFGLARRDEGSILVTLDGQVLGTPAYMSPEQAAGDQAKVDGRSDVYSLGVVLYELLAGELPFRGSVPMLLHQVINDEARSPRWLNDHIPRDLETICLKAMAKSPGRRYASAGDMAGDLRRFLNGLPILARPVGRRERALKWVRRRPAVAALLATVAGLLLAVTVGSIFASVRFAQVAKGEREAKIDAGRQRHHAEEAAARARAERGLLLLEGGNAEGLLDLLAARESMESTPDAQEPWSILWSGWYAACKNRLERVVGHDDEVTRVAFSSDGELLATASYKTVRLWKTATGQPHGGALQLRRRFCDMTFSPDGKTLAVATSESTLRLWDTSACQPLDKSVQTEGVIFAVRFSPDGKLLAIATDKEFGLWDTYTWQRRVRSFQHYHGAPLSEAIAFSPDGSLLAVGMAWGSVHVLETATGKPHCQPLHQGRSDNPRDEQIMGVAFSPDGKRLVTGSRHNTARLWDMHTGQPHGEVMKHQEHVWGVAFSPKGNLVATASYDGTARLWDAETGTPRGPPLRHEGPVAAVAFHADGSLLATCSFDTTARLWNTATGQAVGTPLRHQGAVRAMAFSRDNQSLATASGDRTARLWRIKPENPQLWSARHSDRVYDVAFSADGKDLLTGTDDGLVQLLDAGTGECRGQPLQRPAKGVMPVVSVAISPDGKLMAANGQPVRIWERDTRRQRDERLPLENAWVVRFSPTGKLLAMGPTSDGPIHLWDLETKKLRIDLVAHKDRVESLAFSPDGRLLLSGSADKTAVLWDVMPAQQRYTLPHPEGVEAVAVSPDGKLLATACKDLTVRFWEAETGQPAGQPFRYHTRISALAFSPDGKMLATASWDGTARLWALPAGLPCSQPFRHELVANSVAFSPDGKFLATGSFDKTARLWRVPVLIRDLHEMELRTWVALGARLNAQGIVEAIPWGEWQELRKELRGLEQARGPGFAP
jgi:eukaryotic-like serine/threonine-protein kinase